MDNYKQVSSQKLPTDYFFQPTHYNTSSNATSFIFHYFTGPLGKSPISILFFSYFMILFLNKTHILSNLYTSEHPKNSKVSFPETSYRQLFPIFQPTHQLKYDFFSVNKTQKWASQKLPTDCFFPFSNPPTIIPAPMLLLLSFIIWWTTRQVTDFKNPFGTFV